MAIVGRPAAPGMLGLGRWLLRSAGQVLPPALARHVERAEAQVPVEVPPAGWTADLAAARVADLVRSQAQER
jgi:hypothetical protein